MYCLPGSEPGLPKGASNPPIASRCYHRLARVGFAAILSLSVVAGGLQAESLIVGSDTTLVIDATYDSVAVLSGANLIANALITTTGDFRVAGGGSVSHSRGQLLGLRLVVGGALRVQGGGSIRVSSMGLRGARNSGQGDAAEAYNVAGQLTTRGGDLVGGSHGGIGGHSGAEWVYEQLENPQLLGSGGGKGGSQNGCCGTAGGNGGGVVRIMAPGGVVEIDGEIVADGQRGDWTNTAGLNLNPGGGAGGSIVIQAGTIRGSGVIRAAGGLSEAAGLSGPGGSGGGGRIALWYDQLELPEANISAPAGNAPVTGSAGTVFLRPSATDATAPGDLIVDNGGVVSGNDTPLRTNLSYLGSVIMRNAARGTLQPLGQTHLALRGTIILQGSPSLGRSLTIPGPLKLSMPIFDPIGTGTVVLGQGAVLEPLTRRAIIGTGVEFRKDGTFYEDDQIDDLFIKPHARVTHSPHASPGLNINLVGRLVIEVDGALDALGAGLSGGRGNSLFGLTGEAVNESGTLVPGSTGGARSSAGGSHGGQGASGDEGTPSPSVGAASVPALLGGGGGASVNSSGSGGAGGGRITIRAKIVEVNGTIVADGFGGGNGAGGGAGGSILVVCDSLLGFGSITARGGGSACNPGGCSGGGGGGRIAVYASANEMLPSSIDVSGGTGGYTGARGSIHLDSGDGLTPITFTPSVAGNIGTVTLRVLGVSHSPDLRATLDGPNGTSVDAERIAPAGPVAIDVTFTFAAIPLGEYHLGLFDATHGERHPPDVLSIVVAVYPSIEVSILGRDVALQGASLPLLCRVANRGNTDALGDLSITVHPGMSLAYVALNEAARAPTQHPSLVGTLLTVAEMRIPPGTTVDIVLLRITIQSVVPHAIYGMGGFWRPRTE